MKLSSNALKWIAMVTMLIDHTGLVILQYWLEYGESGGALGGFLWALWAVFKSMEGREFGDYTIVMYRYAKNYYRKIVSEGLLKL